MRSTIRGGRRSFVVTVGRLRRAARAASGASFLIVTSTLMATTIAFAADSPKLSTGTSRLVERFIKTPTQKLPPDRVEEFLAVKEADLPANLRGKYRTKAFELRTLQHLAQGRKKGYVRMPEPDCQAPHEAKSNEAAVLISAGYGEILSHEEDCIMEKTKCTERDLLCEFTLQIVVEQKKGKKKVRYFLHEKDPLMAVLAGCRSVSGVGGNTNFFGRAGGAYCAH